MRLATSTTLFLCALSGPAAAQETVFSRTYVRTNGPPVTVTDTFAVCNPAGQFTLVVLNGPDGTRKVSSGSISVNGVEVIHPSDFNQHVERIERALTNIVASNGIDVRLASAPGSTILVSVLASQSCGIRITSPAAGSTLAESDVLVQGTYPETFGADVGVTVNGTRGLAGGGRFAAVVPVDAQVTSLTAVAKNAAGVTLDDDTIAVTVQAGGGEPVLRLGASPATGIAPLAVELTLLSTAAVSQIALDQDGDGVTDFQGPSLDGLRFTYAQPGVYLATAVATTPAGPERASVIIQAYDRATLEALLQARWQAMKDALRLGDVGAAVQFISDESRERYRTAFETMAADLPQIESILTSLTFVRAWGPEVTFQMQRSDDGVQKSFEVRFGVDGDGVWRLRAF